MATDAANTSAEDEELYARAATGAFRMATAVCLTLVITAWFRLEHGNLAAWTSFMAMVRTPFSSFQKGFERATGRILGMLVGLVLVNLTRNVWELGFVLEILVIACFFYIHFSQRLAYTFLNAGLYLAVMMSIGRSDLASAPHETYALGLAVVVGVFVANMVNWLSGAERDLTINTAGLPLWPIDPLRVHRCLVLLASLVVTQIVSSWLMLPQDTALISLMVLTAAADLPSLALKGKLRLAGAALALVYASVSMVLLYRAPHFPLLVALLFLGIYIAAYVSICGKRYDYAGVQMGLVLPMLMVSSVDNVAELSVGISRIIGVVTALSVAMVVGSLWPVRTPESPLPTDSPLPSSNPLTDSTATTPIGAVHT